MPAVGEHLATKYYVEEAISTSVNESPLLRLNHNEEGKLDEEDSIILNSTLSSLKTKIELPPKLMSIAYMNTVEIDKIYQQYSTIRIMNSIITS